MDKLHISRMIKRTHAFVSVWGPSLPDSFIGPLAVRSELEPFYYERSIGNGFCSQTPCFSQMLVVSSQP
ncbi:MAG: hypothetical protein JWO91_1998 [Acidobacteriaceae bacterium]|nr:hypothetical protein [Acidobacteriaceae bacterium]